MPASASRPALGSSASGYAAALSLLGFPAHILESMTPASLIGPRAADPEDEPEAAESEQLLVYAALLHRLAARTRAILTAGHNKRGGIGAASRVRGAAAARAAWIIDQSLVSGYDDLPADALTLPGAPELISQASTELAWQGHQLYRMALVMHGAGSMEAATLEERVLGAERAAAAHNGSPCPRCGLPGVGDVEGGEGHCEDVPDGLLAAASVLAAAAAGLALATSELRRPDAPPDARAWTMLLRSLGEASSLAATSACAAGVAAPADGGIVLLIDDPDEVDTDEVDTDEVDPDETGD